MTVAQFRTITAWPEARTANQKRSPFRATYGRTLDLLQDELDRINAKEVIIESFHQPRDVRLDGFLRADAREPAYPGIILSFEMKQPSSASRCQYCRKGWSKWDAQTDKPYHKAQGGNQYPCADPKPRPLQLRYPCDKWDDWRDNLRAIALSLQHLRKVETYGVVKGQQYIGMGQLPPAPAHVGSGMSDDSAARILAGYGGFNVLDIMSHRTVMEAAYRNAANKAHPDHGGSHEQMAKVNLAAQVLRARFGQASSAKV
jgi:hypothetical protein